MTVHLSRDPLGGKGGVREVAALDCLDRPHHENIWNLFLKNTRTVGVERVFGIHKNPQSRGEEGGA